MSLTRSLTRPLTRKISRADLTQGFGGSFSPFALNPYLLFDARDSMVGTLENPTLDLNPALPETLDVITATRAGVATYTDADGNIASAPANTVRVDYTQGAELTPNIYQLVGNTDFTQSHWTKTASTVESGHISPDGTANAYKLIEDTSDSVHRIFETSTVSASPNATISVFVKYSGRRYVLIRFADQSVGRWYDLISGTLGITYLATPNDSTIEAIGNDWYRITLTHTSNAQARCEFWVSDTQSISSYTGDGESGVYIYGPQLEEGTTASSFVANTTGSPKFLSSAVYSDRVPMVLIEPSATNLLPYSEDFGAWGNFSAGTGSNPIITSNYVTSPDGNLNASRIQFNRGSGTTSVDTSYITYGLSAGTIDATLSVYLKTNDGSTKDITLRLGSSIFDYNVSVTPEWKRFTLSGNTSVDRFQILLYGNQNSQTADLSCFGAQLEAGSVATSYIPTSGGDSAARTRAADDLVISGSDFSDFYNASEGTVYAESVTKKSDGQPFVFSANSDTSNRIIYYYNTTTTASVYVATSGVGQVNSDVGNRPAAGTLSRGSLSYKTNNVQGSVDGGSVVSDTSVSIPSVDKLTIGNRVNLIDQYNLNGHIKRLIYWPTHSSRL